MNQIAKSAQVAVDARIGLFTVIEDGAVIEPGCVIGNRVTIYQGTVIGRETIIADGAVLGKRPTLSVTSTMKEKDDLPALVIGKRCKIGVSAVVYAGTTLGDATVVGDLASVRENCKIGSFTVIGRGVAVENQVTIGDYVKTQTNAYITAHTVVEDRVFIGPCAKTYNDNFMGRTEKRFKYIKGPTIRCGARIGGGSIILPGIEIGEETFVAAGALVTKDTAPGTLVKGVPARVERLVPEEQKVPK